MKLAPEVLKHATSYKNSNEKTLSQLKKLNQDFLDSKYLTSFFQATLRCVRGYCVEYWNRLPAVPPLKIESFPIRSTLF